MVSVVYLQHIHRREDLRHGQQRAAPAAEQGLRGHLRPRGSQHHREAPGLRDHVPGSILHPARGGPGLARGGPTAWPVARRGTAEDGLNTDPGGFIEVNGISLYVEEHGAGVPVLLMHGFPDSARLWRNQVPFLGSNGFRVITPDMRGFGRSGRPQEVAAYRLPNVVADVTGLLDAFGIEAAHVVGHDWGAAAAWLTATFAPDRVRTLVVISLPHPLAPAALRQHELAWDQLFFQFAGVAEAATKADHWAGLRGVSRGGGRPGPGLEGIA